MYSNVLLGALKFRWLVVVSASRLVIFSIWLATRLGSEFIPQLIEGDITVHSMRILGAGIGQAIDMQNYLRQKSLYTSKYRLCLLKQEPLK